MKIVTRPGGLQHAAFPRSPQRNRDSWPLGIENSVLPSGPKVAHAESPFSGITLSRTLLESLLTAQHANSYEPADSIRLDEQTKQSMVAFGLGDCSRLWRLLLHVWLSQTVHSGGV